MRSQSISLHLHKFTDEKFKIINENNIDRCWQSKCCYVFVLFVCLLFFLKTDEGLEPRYTTHKAVHMSTSAKLERICDSGFFKGKNTLIKLMCLHNYIGNLHVATCSPLETTSTDRLKALFFFISLSKWFLITLFNLITLWQSMEYRTHHHHYSDLAPNIQHIFYFAHAFPIWFCAQLGNRVAKYWNIQFFLKQRNV